MLYFLGMLCYLTVFWGANPVPKKLRSFHVFPSSQPEKKGQQQASHTRFAGPFVAPGPCRAWSRAPPPGWATGALGASTAPWSLPSSPARRLSGRRRQTEAHKLGANLWRKVPEGSWLSREPKGKPHTHIYAHIYINIYI